MLRARRQVETLVGKGIIGMNACVIGINVVNYGMGDINIEATQGIDDFGEAIQANPGIAINGDAIVFFNCETRLAHTVIKIIVLRGPEEKSLVDFMHTSYIGYVHPGVTWNGN